MPAFPDPNRSPPLLPDAEALRLLVTRTMPFGKHKGTLIADLPGNYLNWFAREGFPPGEIGRLLALMHELDHNGLSDLLKPLREGAGRIPSQEKRAALRRPARVDRPCGDQLRSLNQLAGIESGGSW